MPADPTPNHVTDRQPAPAESVFAKSYAARCTEIQREFAATGDGRRATRQRADLVDSVVEELYRALVSRDLFGPKDFCLVGLGGYGRRELFPCSDVDLLFLFENGRLEESRREAIAAMSRALWDLKFRLGHTTRPLAECGELRRDNLEFSVSLLDSRYLAGDREIFDRLHDRVVPHLIARDGIDLARDLVQMTERRYEKHDNTIFHLEPNLKDAPGGLRDYHVARWLLLISELEKPGRWVTPEELWPPALGAECARAFDFFSAARCFLHYRQERDENQLTYELQDLAAGAGVGVDPGRRVAAGEWMRGYFRHARAVHRLAEQYRGRALPTRSSLYHTLQEWNSRLSNADFSVVRGRIYPRQPAALEAPGVLLDLFELVARHGLALSREAERAVEGALGRAGWPVDGAGAPSALWARVRRILVLPHAADALRALHRLGVLVKLFPEFRAIDCLVVRDFYHRYTVDEHSFMTIQHLHRLGSHARRAASHGPSASPGVWEQKLVEIRAELERPELLYLTLLFHDVGKGLPQDDHVEGSLEAVEGILERLELEAGERETVRFLIRHHLDMSATFQRRDIFDPETVRAFAERIGTPERLKMLCLLTYADIKSVNPQALTPWKAEMLWRLYAATSNYLARSLDEERFHAAPGEVELGKADQVRRLLAPSLEPDSLDAFLEGFPRRYLESHVPEEIVEHFRLARELAESPVQLSLRHRERFYEFVVLTADRPFLFASLTGTLAAWGMNIVKADAFSNRAGVVLDTFRFEDLYRTLELNPSESARLEACVAEVLTGKVSIETLMKGRQSSPALARAKVRVPTQVRFDDASSSHSTLLELITQDRHGLLYQVSSLLAELGCNIEVALIDTEGQKVIDVFYLTRGGAKLDAARQQTIRDALLARLEPSKGVD